MRLSFFILICAFIVTACNPTKNPPAPKTTTQDNSTSTGSGRSTELEEPSSATIDQNAVKPQSDQMNEDLDTQQGSGSGPEVFDEEEDYEEDYLEEEPIDENVQRMEKNGSSVNEQN